MKRRWKKWWLRMSEPLALLAAFWVGRDTISQGWTTVTMGLTALIGIIVLVDVLFAFVGLLEDGHGPTKDH